MAKMLRDWTGRGLLIVVALVAIMVLALEIFAPQPADAQSNVVPGYQQISAGSRHTCALTEAGAVTCWGNNNQGEADAPSGRYHQVSAGWQHTCALTETGAVTCWGENSYAIWTGRYERNWPFKRIITTERGVTDAPSGRYQQVSAGSEHTCALTETGAVTCWGENSYWVPTDRFGNWQGQPRRVYTQRIGITDAPSGRYQQVSAGWDHTCALTETGAVTCWGDNSYLRRATGSDRFVASGGVTDVPSGRYQQVSAGGEHTCALTEAGAVTCWGNNGSGRANAPSGRYQQVSAGYEHTCALTEAGAVTCWGNNRERQTSTPSVSLTGCPYVNLGAVSGGTQRSGRLTATDCQPRNGEPADVYRLTLDRASDIDWKVDGHDHRSALYHLDGRWTNAGSQRLTPGEYWLAIFGSSANVNEELAYALTVEVQPSDLSLDLEEPTRCKVNDLGEVRGNLVRIGTWAASDCADGDRYVDWHKFSLPPLGLPEEAGERELRIDVRSPDTDPVLTRVQCAADYRAAPPVLSDRTLGRLSSTEHCHLFDDSSGDGVDARLSWHVRTHSTRLIYWIAVSTSGFGSATGSYTLEITAPEPAEGAPPSYRPEEFQAPINTSGRIVARLLGSGQIEFGWQPEGGERVLPRLRNLPVEPPTGRWLNSSDVVVDGVAVGKINVRVDPADGRVEFAFTPAGGERISPRGRYFPEGVRVNAWLQSTPVEWGGG